MRSPASRAIDVRREENAADVEQTLLERAAHRNRVPRLRCAVVAGRARDSSSRNALAATD